MAFTSTAVNTIEPHGQSQASVAYWAYNVYTDDASACEEIVATPGSGKALYITKIEIQSDVHDIITIGAGETSNGVTAAIIGPIPWGHEDTGAAHFSAAHFLLVPSKPIKLTTNKSMTIDAGAVGGIWVYVEGFTL